MVSIPDADARALVGGESIVAFVPRGTLTEGDEVRIVATGARDPATLKPAYRRWAAAGPPQGEWQAVVVAVHPAVSLDTDTGSARHILADAGTGDLALVRVFDGDDPVLSDDAFAARRRAVESALVG